LIFWEVRDRVESAAGKWAAAGEAVQGKPGALGSAPTLDSFKGIVGTGRMEFAGAAEEWGEQELVEIQERDQEGGGDAAGLLFCGKMAVASRQSSSVERAPISAEATDCRG
jgi:hypothetical protein